jgi:plasmid maintenance system killer protein
MDTINFTDEELLQRVFLDESASEREKDLASRLQRALDEIDALTRKLAEPLA